jgi:4-amino-4-deoxy-L-arabinose transferase-like glycosyltransferase
MNKKVFLVLFSILFLGVFLRFYQLGTVPQGLHRDEAFLGYNAYSILKTGKDMSGNFLPLHLQSFLYSPAGYSYFSIPFIALFGLSAFSVRFASAFFSSGSIVLVFFLSRKIFEDSKDKNLISIVSAFLLAI